MNTLDQAIRDANIMSENDGITRVVFLLNDEWVVMTELSFLVNFDSAVVDVVWTTDDDKLDDLIDDANYYAGEYCTDN